MRLFLPSLIFAFSHSIFTSGSRAGAKPVTFRSRLDAVSDPMETCTPRFLDPMPLLMPRCSEPSWCLAKHGSDKGMPKKLRVMVLCSQRCGPAEICCILHPRSNAEGVFLQGVSKGFFPARCVLVLIQRVSGSRHSVSIAWPLRGAEVWSLVGSQSQFFGRLEPGLPVTLCTKPQLLRVGELGRSLEQLLPLSKMQQPAVG